MTEDKEFSQIREIPSDLSIGEKLHTWIGGVRFRGEINPKPDADLGIYGGPVITTLHEKGIKICNTYYPKQLEIHTSQIIYLEKIKRREYFQKDRSSIGEFLFGILIVITLGFIFSSILANDSSGNGSKKIVKYVSLLEINFWDANTKSEQKITIVGSKFKIQRFIKHFYSGQCG